MRKASPTVEEVLREIGHPMSDLLGETRELILAAHPDIREGVKWNSLSFQTHEWFATLNRRAVDRVEVILHFGAGKHPGLDISSVPDPHHLLRRLAADRASLTVHSASELTDRREALAALITAWVERVNSLRDPT